jgi:hypothetical protein
MLKFKDSKKEFSIVYQSEDMSENTVYDYLFTEREADLLMDNGDVFVLDSNTDIDEWKEMTGIYEEDEFKLISEDFGMSNYFNFV